MNTSGHFLTEQTHTYTHTDIDTTESNHTCIMLLLCWW